ncbi:MAG: HNH endonuclease signature motif containing protein [Acidobacteriota bacterium]
MTSGKSRVPPRLRERVARAAGYRCGYCRTDQRITGYQLTIDHIVPESGGGKTVEENLWMACIACNQHKGAQVYGNDPMTGRRTRLFNPRRQKWKAHFRWSEDGTEIIGLTACGRATVIALQINRPEITAARRLWVGVGWWPPKG